MDRFLRVVWGIGLFVVALSATDVAARTSSAAAQDGASLHYRVTSDAELRILSVHACFSGVPASAFIPGIRDAGNALIDAHDRRGRALPIRNGRIALGRMVRGGCVNYRVDLDRAMAAARFSMRAEHDVLTSLGAWLWRPSPALPEGGARITFALPAGMSAVTPFAVADDGSLILDHSAFTLPAFMAFTHRRPLTIERHGGRIDVIALGEGWAIDDAGIERWMSRLMDGVSTVQGRFPVDRAVVFLVPTPGRGMGFGMVRRGGGSSVGFTVGLESNADDLTASWVGWHELSHLQLPPFHQRDAWLYEGVATYYQEVIAARMGVITDRAAWGSFLSGFDRGARSIARQPLAQAAQSMMENGAFLRVYWSGAVFALEADVQLRAAGSSLDAQLRRTAHLWRRNQHVWTSEEVCALLDQNVEGDPISALCARYRERVGFPPTQPLLEDLGVRRVNDHIELSDGRLAPVRRAIFLAP